MSKKYLILFFLSITIVILSQNMSANELGHIKRGAIEEKRGDYIKAIEEYKKALVYNPKLIEVYISIGNIYHQKLNDNKMAYKIYLKGLEIAPYDFKLNLNLIYLYFTDNDIESGIKHYKMLSKINQDNKEFSFTREIINNIFQHKDEKEILEFCNKYLAINPSDNILREKLAVLYKKQKKYELAEKELKYLLDQGYSYSMIYFDLGVCSYHLEKYNDSLKYLNKAKELGEYVPDTFFNQLNQKIEET